MSATSERTQQPQRPRPRFRTAEVRRVERLSRSMVRVTLAGPELEGFEAPAPTQHLKFIMPEPGQDRPVLPDPSLPKGVSLPGQPRPTMRTYTVRRYDPTTAELDVDVLLHGEGEGSEWAAQAKPGGIVAVAGPGGRPYAPDLSASWYVIAGDESALPAIGTLLDRLPSSVEAEVYAEVLDAADQIEWKTRAQLHVTWLHRGSTGGKVGSLLEAALQVAKRPAGPGRGWVACEAGIMRRMRRHLLEQWRLDPTTLVTRGYWKEGEANYRDGDYGED